MGKHRKRSPSAIKNDTDRHKKQGHDTLVERAYDDPSMINIDGCLIDPETVLERKAFYKYSSGSDLDLIFLRKIPERACEIDMIEVFCCWIGEGRDTAIRTLEEMNKHCERSPGGFLYMIEDALRVGSGYFSGNYKETWLDLFLFCYEASGLPASKRLPSYSRKRVLPFRK